MSEDPGAGAVLYAKNVPRVSAFYSGVAGPHLVHAEEGHAVLASPTFQLVVVALPEKLVARIDVATPPVRREETPLKLVFRVGSLSAARDAALALGGELNPPTREWRFRGSRVCDGHDPEGNVVQLREDAG